MSHARGEVEESRNEEAEDDYQQRVGGNGNQIHCPHRGKHATKALATIIQTACLAQETLEGPRPYEVGECNETQYLHYGGVGAECFPCQPF